MLTLWVSLALKIYWIYSMYSLLDLRILFLSIWGQWLIKEMCVLSIKIAHWAPPEITHLPSLLLLPASFSGLTTSRWPLLLSCSTQSHSLSLSHYTVFAHFRAGLPTPWAQGNNGWHRAALSLLGGCVKDGKGHTSTEVARDSERGSCRGRSYPMGHYSGFYQPRMPVANGGGNLFWIKRWLTFCKHVLSQTLTE